MPRRNPKNRPKPPNKKANEAKTTTQYLLETLQTTQEDNERLRMQLRKLQQRPSNKIGLLLLAVGAAALIGAVYANAQILAFIGLGLTFWGALFFFVRPIRFVRGTLLDSTAIAQYTTIDRIIDDLGYKGNALYIPPYPKDIYLPDYLKGLKEMVVLIAAEATAAMPTIEEMARKQFLVENPKGICITPPGFGILSMLEDEARTDLTGITRDDLADTLPKLITSNLELASDVEIRIENNLTHVKLEESTYKDLYAPEHGLKSVHLLGCPLASAIACTLCKATGKLVTITKDTVSPDLKTIHLWYQTIEG
jgi:hypothetical protein